MRTVFCQSLSVVTSVLRCSLMVQNLAVWGWGGEESVMRRWRDTSMISSLRDVSSLEDAQTSEKMKIILNQKMFVLRHVWRLVTLASLSQMSLHHTVLEPLHWRWCCLSSSLLSSSLLHTWAGNTTISGETTRTHTDCSETRDPTLSLEWWTVETLVTGQPCPPTTTQPSTLTSESTWRGETLLWRWDSKLSLMIARFVLVSCLVHD